MPRATPTRRPTLSSRVCNGAIAAPDILERIFRLTIHQPSEEERAFASSSDWKLTKTNTPWPFLLVCKHWREIAMTSPFLWSTIVLVSKNARYTDIARSLPLLEAHLHRSRNVALTIVVCISIGTFIPVRGVPQDRRDPVVPLYRLLQTLMGHQHRWQDVVLNIQASAGAPSGEVYQPVPMDFMIRFKDMNMLKKLSIRYFSRPEYCGHQRYELAHCPGLEYLQLVGKPSFRPHDPETFKSLSLRLKTLVCKPDDSKSFTGFWPMLRSVPNVEHLQFMFYRDAQDTRKLKLTSREMPRVKSLSLKMDFEDSTEVLRHISFPSLARLEMEDIVLREHVFVELANDLQKFPLTHLKLEFETAEAATFHSSLFQQFLQSVSGLRHLELSKLKYDNHIGNRSSLVPNLGLAFGLAYRQSGVRILPQLSHLELRLDWDEFNSDVGGSVAGVKDLVAALSKCYVNHFHFVLWSHLRDRNTFGILYHALQVFTTPKFRITINNEPLRVCNVMVLG